MPWLEAHEAALPEAKQSVPSPDMSSLTFHCRPENGGVLFPRMAQHHPCDLPQERLTPSPVSHWGSCSSPSLDSQDGGASAPLLRAPPASRGAGDCRPA